MCHELIVWAVVNLTLIFYPNLYIRSYIKELLNCFVLDHNVFKNLTYFNLHYQMIEIFAVDLIAD